VPTKPAPSFIRSLDVEQRLPFPGNAYRIEVVDPVARNRTGTDTAARGYPERKQQGSDPFRHFRPFAPRSVSCGFDYFIGFVGGDANQWQPNKFRITTAICPSSRRVNFGCETHLEVTDKVALAILTESADKPRNEGFDSRSQPRSADRLICSPTSLATRMAR
jgi:hypothetical protein